MANGSIQLSKMRNDAIKKHTKDFDRSSDVEKAPPPPKPFNKMNSREYEAYMRSRAM